IIVSSNKHLINQNVGDIWNTGRTQNLNNEQILFKGDTLHAYQKYYWKVRVWNLMGEATAWSEVAHFEMGILSQVDWKAKWITYANKEPVDDEDFYKDHPAPLFRKKFSL